MNDFLDHDPLASPVPTPNSSQSTPLPRTRSKNKSKSSSTTTKRPFNQEFSSPSSNMNNNSIGSSSSSNSTPSSPESMDHHHGLSLNLQQTNKRPFFSSSISSSQLDQPHQTATFKELVTSPTNSSTTTSSGRGTVPRVDILKEPKLHQTFQFSGTPGGRLKPHRVGFAEYGSVETGHPAFVIGGHGCSRLVGVMFEELAQRHSIRMIWPERPGYGLSEECSASEMSALDWAEVVIQLADHLGIRRFSIIAQSVGTVFAMAISHKYPGRVLGPLFLISPWVSTQAANTFKWSRRLPAPLVTRTVSLAMDVMWMLNKGTNFNSMGGGTPSSSAGGTATSSTTTGEEENNTSFSDPLSPRTSEASTPTSSQQRTLTSHPEMDLTGMTLQEEDELLASLEEEEFDLPTDFPPHRPLRHAVRPRHMSLYFAMNKLRMSEPYTQGQVLDVLIALEKYHNFGFSYSEINTAVTAVWGDKDGLIPLKAIDVLASGLRDVRFKILDGEGHDLVWKEGVMEWAIRGIAERWRVRTQRLTLTLMNKLHSTSGTTY
ncbi:Alpha/Beta hydrolase protein [Phascolomyces articulosus]|uniref:Alpha/Beta hydrolase protein n=1 Tax=Phascolomyces articulosus TaxID=60185 RepID=A0AAD5K5Z4_9FUNG|nr:Alpha/Beta hydrolase protein [Phascolomyces articulosus]